ncbi:MAG: cbb3-type cytochrome c oxidase subunit 3 [Duganella sp.]
MAIDILFDQASSVMTVVSFTTFLGILWWTYIRHKETDFAKAAQAPFDDEEPLSAEARARIYGINGEENHHG